MKMLFEYVWRWFGSPWHHGCFSDRIIWWEKTIAMARVSCGVSPAQLAAGYEERQEQRLKDAPEIMGVLYLEVPSGKHTKKPLNMAIYSEFSH